MTLETAEEVNSYWEREYNPRVRIQEAKQYFEAWETRAAKSRLKLPRASLDLPYGPDPRERMDLFHAPSARGTLVFLHGGYWRAFGKESYSWVAEPFVCEGVTVAVPSYPLAPAARIGEIVSSLSMALQALSARATPGERCKLVLLGHSAGAHLAACLASQKRAGLESEIDAIVCVSGIFDALPILHTQLLAGMGWSSAELHAVSPLFMPPPSRSIVLLAVGDEESYEFQVQTDRMARAWSARVEAVIRPRDRNHFSVIDDLYDPRAELTRAVTGLF